MSKRDIAANNIRNILFDENRFLTLKEIYRIYLDRYDLSNYSPDGAESFIRTSIYEHCLDRDLYQNNNELLFFSLSAKGEKGNQYGLIEWNTSDNLDDIDDLLSRYPQDINYEDEQNTLYKKRKLSNREEYVRRRIYALYALDEANYKCEYDSNHPSFIRKANLKNYTEAHHLIPLSYQDDFEYRLDVPCNIVSLCSNCHNQLHYGLDKKTILKKLYDDRIERLKKNHLDISFEQLCKYYNL